MTLLLALVTVLCWGTWLYPSRAVPGASQIQIVFFATWGNVFLAGVLLAALGFHIEAAAFAPAFLGGVVWTAGGLCAFAACASIGAATAMSIWAPLNILFSVFFGTLLFGEWVGVGTKDSILRIAGLAGLLAGLAMIIGPGRGAGRSVRGTLLAGLAGLFWGVYLVPVRLAEVRAFDALFPLALGMALSASVWCAVRRVPLTLTGRRPWVWLMGTGLLWGIGNVALFLLIERIGLGMAFALSQLCLVVNALIGTLGFREPPIASPAGRRLIAGCLLAVCGGVAIGVALM